MLKRRKSNTPNAIEAMKVGAHSLYVFNNADKLSSERLLAIKSEFNEKGLGILRSDFIAYTNKINKVCNTDDLSKKQKLLDIMRLTGYLRDYMNNYLNDEIIRDVASLGVLVDDEPYHEPRLKDKIIKKELMKKHKEVKNLFINTTLGYLEQMAVSLRQNNPNNISYLTESELMASVSPLLQNGLRTCKIN